MERKIRVAAVDYLNTKPLIYGFDSAIKNDIDLELHNPAEVARRLINDEVDIGLLPVACIPALRDHRIISDYCIGCDGEVVSVAIFSAVPLKEVTKILLDYQSNTSVALCKFLLKEYWKLSPSLEKGIPGYEHQIIGNTAGLVIGDRALKQRRGSKYIYDLGTAWKDHTGLPFVFAAWVSNKWLPPDFITTFNMATGKGLQHLDEIAAANSFEAYDLNDYYNNKIDYRFNNEKQQALDNFLKVLR